MPAEWELSDDLPDEDVLVIEVTPPWKIIAQQCGGISSSNLGLEIAVDAKQLSLKVYGDSQLVVINPCDDEDDMLREEENHITEVFEVEEEDWRQPLVDYLKYRKLPNDLRWRTDTRRRATRFIYYKGTLYRRSFDGLFLRCLSDNEKVQAMEEAHSRIAWIMQEDVKLVIPRQFDPPTAEPLHPTVASWPFDAWALDVVGPLTKSSGDHLYILAATDYFSKWAEAVPLKEVKKENVADFIRTHIIYLYGVPRYIITDNGKPFRNSLIDKLCQKV
ncbi:UNVERIFIED_CONTAM: hypothetical protein Sradi_6945300 [Sesamum radiatum]|uniref:Integrase catalytic domain-containing protein n=1 Tax=Sesamum radiatum TaxID=300843 RepID=A0AAW2JFR7_SESRA